MKPNIHPKYEAATMVCLSCGSNVPTNSTTPNIRVDICSACHPFYTGKQKVMDTAGRIDKFRQRYGSKAAAAPAAAPAKPPSA